MQSRVILARLDILKACRYRCTRARMLQDSFPYCRDPININWHALEIVDVPTF